MGVGMPCDGSMGSLPGFSMIVPGLPATSPADERNTNLEKGPDQFIADALLAKLFMESLKAR